MTADTSAVGATAGAREESDTPTTEGGERADSGRHLRCVLVADQW
jgi:hypothetical protein